MARWRSLFCEHMGIPSWSRVDVDVVPEVGKVAAKRPMQCSYRGRSISQLALLPAAASL